MLKDYVQKFTSDHRLRFCYFKNRRGEKIGVGVSYFKDGTLFAGVSRAHNNQDKFEVNYGIARAIDRAVPFDKFKAMLTLGQLPGMPLGIRNKRDENGNLIFDPNKPGRLIGGTENYDQYLDFVSRTERRANALQLLEV